MAMRNPTLLGQYAGFVTRAAALIMDIVIIIAAVVYHQCSDCPAPGFFPAGRRADLRAGPCDLRRAGWAVLPWSRPHLVIWLRC